MSATASDLDFPCFQTSDAMGKPSLPNLSSTDENPYKNTPFDLNHVSIQPPPQGAANPTRATKNPAAKKNPPAGKGGRPARRGRSACPPASNAAHPPCPPYETGHAPTEASRDYFARFQTSLYGLPTPVWV